VTAQIAVGGVRTVYARTGDLFAWACVAVLVIALGAAAVLGSDLAFLVFAKIEI
jgi:apolipoprotein N-acyltransferase